MNRPTPTRLQCVLISVCLLATAGCSKQASSPAALSDASLKTIEAGVVDLLTPVLFTTDEGPVRVESPGYASPCWADIDDDGNKDLLVGQFRDGKIRVFKNLGDRKLAGGEWLQAEGSVAEVPGVW